MAQEPEETTDAYSTLTPREQRFVDAYVGEARCNATEAARLAGYKDSNRISLATMGSRLYRKVQIQAAISERVNQFAMTAEEILSSIADIARNSNLTDLIDVETYGKPVIILSEQDPDTGQRRIKPSARLYLKKLSVTEESVSVEVYDRFAALVQLGKFHRIWVERNEVTGQNGEPLFKAYVDVDTEQV